MGGSQIPVVRFGLSAGTALGAKYLDRAVVFHLHAGRRLVGGLGGSFPISKPHAVFLRSISGSVLQKRERLGHELRIKGQASGRVLR